MEGWLDLWDVDHSIALQMQSKEKVKSEFPVPVWTHCYCFAYPDESCLVFVDGRQVSGSLQKSILTGGQPSVGPTDESSSEIESAGQIIGGDVNSTFSLRTKVATPLSQTPSTPSQSRAFPNTTPQPPSRITGSFSTSKLKELFGGFLSKAKSTTRLERRKGSNIDLMTSSVIGTPGKSLEVAELPSGSICVTTNQPPTFISTLKRTRSLGLIGKKRSRAQLTPSSTLEGGLSGGGSRTSSAEHLPTLDRSPVPFLAHLGLVRNNTLTSNTPQPGSNANPRCVSQMPLVRSNNSTLGLSTGGNLLTLRLTKTSWIRALHSSLTNGHKYCLAITAEECGPGVSGRLVQSQRTIAMSFVSEHAMKMWHTCFKRMAKPNLENVRHRENSLKITIQEAKNLPPKRRFFCDLCLDRCFHARTTTKVSAADGTLSWYEEFDLKNLVEISRVTINLYMEGSSSKKRKSRKKGYHERTAFLTLPVSELGRSTWGSMLSIPSGTISPQQDQTHNSTDINADSIGSSTSTSSSYFLSTNVYPPLIHSTLCAPSSLANCNGMNETVLPSTDIFTTNPPPPPVAAAAAAAVTTAISLRVEGKYESVEVLPLACYVPLKEIALHHYEQLVPLLQMASSAKTKYELGHCLVSIHQRHQSAPDFLANIIRSEVLKQEEVSLLFRENTMATKSIDAYMQLVGDQYLWSLVKPFAQDMLQCDAVFESDPTRIRQPSATDSATSAHSSHSSSFSSGCGPSSNLTSSEQKQLDKNQMHLQYYTMQIWTTIYDNAMQMPSEMRQVFARIREVLEPIRGGTFCDTLISACVFLRFFTPALYSPSLFGFCDVPTLQENSGRVKRNFTLVAKCLQQLANLNDSFSEKEGYLHFMNNFLRKQVPRMRDYLHLISSSSCGTPRSDAVPSSTTNISRTPVPGSGSFGRGSADDLSVLSNAILSSHSARVNDFIDLGYELARLHRLLKTHLQETEKEFASISLNAATDHESATISPAASGRQDAIEALRDIRKRVAEVLAIVDQYLEDAGNYPDNFTPSATQTPRSQHHARGATVEESALKMNTQRSISVMSSSSATPTAADTSLFGNFESLNLGNLARNGRPVEQPVSSATLNSGGRRRYDRYNQRYATTTVTAASIAAAGINKPQVLENPWLPREKPNNGVASTQDPVLVDRVGQEWNQLVAMAEKVVPYHTTSLPRPDYVSLPQPSFTVEPLVDNPVYGWGPATDIPPPTSSAPTRQMSSHHTPPSSTNRHPAPRLGVSSVIQHQRTQQKPAPPQSTTTGVNGVQSVGLLDQMGPSPPMEGVPPTTDLLQYEQLLSDLQQQLETTRKELSFMSEKLEQAESDKRFLQQLLQHDPTTVPAPAPAPNINKSTAQISLAPVNNRTSSVAQQQPSTARLLAHQAGSSHRANGPAPAPAVKPSPGQYQSNPYRGHLYPANCIPPAAPPHPRAQHPQSYRPREGASEVAASQAAVVHFRAQPSAAGAAPTGPNEMNPLMEPSMMSMSNMNMRRVSLPSSALLQQVSSSSSSHSEVKLYHASPSQSSLVSMAVYEGQQQQSAAEQQHNNKNVSTALTTVSSSATHI